MKTIMGWLLALVVGGAILGTLAASGSDVPSQTALHRPELDYLKAVNARDLPATRSLSFC